VLDGYGRTIDYVRISVTDRCDLRCSYCMPEEGVAWLPHEDILRYEEILRLCRIFTELGITRFKITGGEPLVRRGVAGLIRELKALPGAESVTLTTNGVTLKQHLEALTAAGVDGVNISLDTLDRERYRALTRRDALPAVLEGLEAALARPGLHVKLNCVLLAGGEADWVSLAGLARERKLAVRFIELMPLGRGAVLPGAGEAALRTALEAAYGPLTPAEGRFRGNGPCRYFSLPGFVGAVGLISALSHQFCDGCNRVRLTAAGFLKTCLQYDLGTDLKPLLTGPDEALREAIEGAIRQKPRAHCFDRGGGEHPEQHIMSQIGG